MTTTTDTPAVQTQDIASQRPVPRQRPPHVGELPRGGGVQEESLPADLGQPKDAPAEPASPPTLTAVHQKLCKPFAQALIELKPGATTKDKSRALAMPYVDLRAYQTRLDRVVGPEGWAVEYRPLSERAVLCRLTVLGVTREDVGEAELEEFDRQSGEMKPNPNVATAAVAQAFKRACAAFGLGRYLYALPKAWGDYDNIKKEFKDPAGLVHQMYAQAAIVNGANE